MSVVNRYLTGVARPCHRQLSTRIGVAEQSISHRVPPSLPACHASRIAGTCEAAHSISSGRPFTVSRINIKRRRSAIGGAPGGSAWSACRSNCFASTFPLHSLGVRRIQHANSSERFMVGPFHSMVVLAWDVAASASRIKRMASLRRRKPCSTSRRVASRTLEAYASLRVPVVAPFGCAASAPRPGTGDNQTRLRQPDSIQAGRIEQLEYLMRNRRLPGGALR